MRRFAAVLVLVCCEASTLAVPTLPQTPTQSQGQASVIKTQVTLVKLFATVRDKNENIVMDLKQDDFKIFEDNHQEKIVFFSKEMAPLTTLGLILDTSGGEQNNMGAIQDAGSRFLHHVLRKGDEAMVFSFDSAPELLSDLTDDRGQLDRAISKARVDARDLGQALYDAIYMACRNKLNGKAGRKALVIVTDAQDNQSRVLPTEAIEEAQRTDTVIHLLLIAGPRHEGNVDVAYKLAHETGGRMISVSSEENLEEAFDQISEELRSQYALGYYPTSDAKDAQFRRIKVELRSNDLKVLARRGYYAPRR
jgi:VWFA-related protein